MSEMRLAADLHPGKASLAPDHLLGSLSLHASRLLFTQTIVCAIRDEEASPLNCSLQTKLIETIGIMCNCQNKGGSSAPRDLISGLQAALLNRRISSLAN